MSARTLLLAMVGLGLGCIRSADPLPPVVPPEPEVPALGDDVFVRAAGQGPTEDDAYAVARDALAEALLGDVAWAELAELQVHRRGIDPQRVVPGAQGVEVELGLTRTQAAGVLSAFENAEPPPEGPPAWQEALLAARRAHLAAQACARRSALFGSACEPVDTSDADGALARLGDGLALDPAYRYGVPVDGEGHPLRPPAVYVFWGGVPIPEVPVVAEGAGELRLHGRSDLTGRAVITLDEGTVLAPLRVRIDGEAMMGPLRELAPRAEISLEPVGVGWDRWAMVIGRGREGWQSSDPTMAGVLDAMRKAGHPDPLLIGPGEAKSVLEAEGDARHGAARALGDRYSGRLDVVLVLGYESRFASRMGGNRVWYEAEGWLEARSAWTGERLGRAEAKVEADGVGDERAEKAARRKLGAALTEQVLAAR
ncbi:MAG: hypothetical protein KC501_10470 [Myxococcales bacterium]|nr:hypothetical protein [Myxococcales bacterium]